MELPPTSCAHLEPVGRGRSEGRVPAPALMSFEAYCRRIAQLSELAELELSGPLDPLLHPRFFDMVRYAAARGVQVTARSPLLWLSDRRAEECVQSGLARLLAVLEAPRPRPAIAIRVDVPFNRALRNLSRLAGTKRRLGARLPRLEVLETVAPGKLGELPELVRSSHRHGAEVIHITFIKGEEEELERSLGEARALATLLGVELHIQARA
jgi:MoaA/NifB/PqqE/SkfB family radical SAM enzyme